MIVEHRDKIKAMLLLSNPPAWLKQLFELYWSGHQSPVRMTSPASGKAEAFLVQVSTKNIAAAVAAEIGMSVLEWERIRPEVERTLGSWKETA